LRALRLTVIPLLAACSNDSPSARQPAPGTPVVRAPLVITDTPPPPPVINAPTPEWERRYDSVTALVDTIVILSPDSVVLHVGQSVGGLVGLVQFEGRRRTGERVPFRASVEVEDISVAQNRVAGLAGLRAGRTRIVVRASSRQPGVAHARSYLPVIVLR
jgi:hypothetical protein